MDYSRPDLADRLAAEYVTGTLRGPARRRLQALLPAHPTLRAAVARWHDRLIPLTASVAATPPPKAVWLRIEQRIGGTPVAAPTPASWWSGLALWRTLTATGAVAVLALAVMLAQTPPALPPVVVVLDATSPVQGIAPASFVASISGDGRAIVTRPLVNVSLQADRALELWAVPASGAPTSLGLISERSATVVRRSGIAPGTAALAVSLEPAGGSPTGAPTGPILYVGKLTI